MLAEPSAVRKDGVISLEKRLEKARGPESGPLGAWRATPVTEAPR